MKKGAPRARVKKVVSTTRRKAVLALPKRVRRARTRTSDSKRNPLSREAAPVAVSRSGRTSVNYTTVSQGGMSGLRISASVPLCEIGNDGQYLNGFFVQGSGSTPTPFYATNLALLPYQLIGLSNGASAVAGIAAQWISPHIPLLALAFDRYRMESLSFRYEPQSTAVVSDRLVFAWTDDPSHPILGDNPSSVPSQLQCLITQDSVAFMPWKEWSLKVPVARDMRFLYESAPTSVSDRFSCMGAASCVASTSSVTPTAVVYGVLYVQMVIDLFDPVPIVSSVNALIGAAILARSASRRTMSHSPSTLPATKPALVLPDRSESKEPVPLDVDDDPSVADSPYFKVGMTPSAAPGGALYVPSSTSLMTRPGPVKVPSKK